MTTAAQVAANNRIFVLRPRVGAMTTVAILAGMVWLIARLRPRVGAMTTRSGTLSGRAELVATPGRGDDDPTWASRPR